MKLLKDIITRIFPNQVKLFQNFRILKNDFALFQSIKKSVPLNKQGEAIPWYTYPATEYLSQFDFSYMEILEFGSGYSTVFWEKRCKKITSVEHVETWLNKVKEIISKENTELIYLEKDNYTDICKNVEHKYDIVIIDGIKRTECAKELKNCLNPETGMVILDNSDWYPETARYLRDELNLFEFDFFGFGPINNYTWCTSVFVSGNLVLKPLKKQPVNGIASLLQNCDND